MNIEIERTSPKEREAEKVWEEVIAEASRQTTDVGIPANRVEWSHKIEGLGERKFRMNVKPMYLDQNKRISIVISSLYRDKDHIELCMAIANWNGNTPYVLSAMTSPVGALTPLELSPLEFGKYAIEVVKSGVPKAPYFPQSDTRPN